VRRVDLRGLDLLQTGRRRGRRTTLLGDQLVHGDAQTACLTLEACLLAIGGGALA
jgi:hypothetical protein